MDLHIISSLSTFDTLINMASKISLVNKQKNSLRIQHEDNEILSNKEEKHQLQVIFYKIKFFKVILGIISKFKWYYFVY